MAREHNYYVYMLASRIGGTLYVGVTSDIAYRVSQHREGVGSAFTARYGERIKKWPRKWKVRLIEAGNPHWADLFPSSPTLAITGSPGQAGR